MTSNFGDDYLTVNEMTFFLKEKQDSKHRPSRAGSDSAVQRPGEELWGNVSWHLLSTHCARAVLLAHLKYPVQFSNHSRRFVLYTFVFYS